MPLFNRSQDEQQQPDNEQQQQQQVDERTRLLPPGSSSGGPGTLTPDDPAVTPYNLWTIRVLRLATVALGLVTAVWFALVLVSAFATPPGLETRGGPFTALGFASLALANVGFALVFFGAPARAVRILRMIRGALLLTNTIVILAVQRTRSDEGWVGTVSVAWALLMSLWTVAADRTVKWGKAEEEERLTGRAETRRTAWEWFEVLVSTVGEAVMTAAVVLMTLTVVLRALDAGVAAPGRMYPVDGGRYRVHVYCRGNTTTTAATSKLPTVLIEGGERSVEGGGLRRLADEALDNGSITRYCYADRPGWGWSDAAPSPLSASFATDVLGEALAAAGEQGPWVLLGAGTGGIYQRVFSSRHGADVRGMVLVDALHEEYLGDLGAPGRGFLLWVRGFLSPLGLDRIPGAVFGGRSRQDRVYGRAERQGSRNVFARLQEALVAGSFTRRDVQAARAIQLRDTPLVVVSSGQRVKADERWARGQRDLTHLTDKLKHWDIVDGAPHDVWKTDEGAQAVEKRLRQVVHGA